MNESDGSELPRRVKREPRFTISIAAEMVNVHAQTLRHYERIGLIQPKRSVGKIRYYTLAERESNSQVEDLHLLAALLEPADGVAVAVLTKLNSDVARLRGSVQQALARLPKAYGSNVQPAAAATLRAPLQKAQDEAARLKDEYVSVEHLLVALADETNRGRAGEILRGAGVTRDKIYGVLADIRGGQRVTTPTPEGTYQALEKYGRNYTDLARQNKLDPVIGRDEEIR